MTNNNHHMLDTNVILAMVLPGDNGFEDAEEYLKTAYTRYISQNTKDEAEKKITNIRKISLNLSNFIKKYSLENNINYLKIDKDKFHAKKSFLDKFKDKRLPINMPPDRFEDFVKEFFNNNDNEITLVLINNDNQDLNDLIRDSFSENIVNLNDFVGKYYQITFVSSGSKVEDFKNINAHQKDAILLDEAYHLHLTLNEPVNFITFDSDVLSLKNKIHTKISKKLTVSSPIEFKPVQQPNPSKII